MHRFCGGRTVTMRISNFFQNGKRGSALVAISLSALLLAACGDEEEVVDDPVEEVQDAATEVDETVDDATDEEEATPDTMMASPAAATPAVASASPVAASPVASASPVAASPVASPVTDASPSEIATPVVLIASPAASPVASPEATPES